MSCTLEALVAVKAERPVHIEDCHKDIISCSRFPLLASARCTNLLPQDIFLPGAERLFSEHSWQAFVQGWTGARSALSRAWRRFCYCGSIFAVLRLNLHATSFTLLVAMECDRACFESHCLLSDELALPICELKGLTIRQY